MPRGLRLLLFVVLPAVALGGALYRFGSPVDGLISRGPETVAENKVPEPRPEPTAPAPAPAPAPVVPSAPAASPPAPPQVVVPTPSFPPGPAPVPAGAQTQPAFDLVRVEPDGSLVVAGRAEGGRVVTLLRNGEVWDRASTSAGGQFAMTPKELPPGTHELSLVMTYPDGRIATSEQIVTVDVPAAKQGDVVVALVAPNQPTRVLSPKQDLAAAPVVGMTARERAGPQPSQPERPGVEVGVVEQEVGGTFFAGGTAAPGATVRLYVNDSYLATATAGPDGKWSFSVGKGLTEGSYRVRLDDVRGTDGKVLSRAEVPFEFAARPPLAGSQAKAVDPSTVIVPEVKTTTVARGDSLWRISQRVYGNGRRYIVIHRANEEQIRNPDLIYPGQVFVLPGEKTP